MNLIKLLIKRFDGELILLENCLWKLMTKRNFESAAGVLTVENQREGKKNCNEKIESVYRGSRAQGRDRSCTSALATGTSYTENVLLSSCRSLLAKLRLLWRGKWRSQNGKLIPNLLSSFQLPPADGENLGGQEMLHRTWKCLRTKVKLNSTVPCKYSFHYWINMRGVWKKTEGWRTICSF